MNFVNLTACPRIPFPLVLVRTGHAYDKLIWLQNFRKGETYPFRRAAG